MFQEGHMHVQMSLMMSLSFLTVFHRLWKSGILTGHDTWWLADMISQVGWVGDSESAVDSPQFLPFFLQERQSLHSVLHAAGHFPFRKDIRYIEHLLLEKQEWLIWFDLHFTPEIELECKYGHFKGISWSPCEASMCSVSYNPAPPKTQKTQPALCVQSHVLMLKSFINS